MATRTIPPIDTTKRFGEREEQKGHAGFLDYAGVALDSVKRAGADGVAIA